MPTLSNTMKTLCSLPLSFIPSSTLFNPNSSHLLFRNPGAHILPLHFCPPHFIKSPISLPQPPSCLFSPKTLSSLAESPSWRMEVRSPFGEVHVIIGPMFAGKTTALLRRVQRERENGRNVVIIKSDKDTRYGLESIVTHDGAKFPCWALPDLLSFKDKVGADEYDKLDVIGIDEAQFFDDLYDFCRKAADHDGKIIVAAGLDGDYLRRRFGSVLNIVPLADSVVKLTARCEICGKRAFFTLRKTAETKTELIGGADMYMPVCRQHYVNGQVIVEAARSLIQPPKVQCDRSVEEASISLN